MAGDPERKLTAAAPREPTKVHSPDPGARRGPRVGLVLAAGGVAGYGFHTGALLALQQATGWDPRSADIIVGTSSGALVASIVAAGLSTSELRERVMRRGPESETDGPLQAVAGWGSLKVPRLWGGPARPGLLAAELRRGLGASGPKVVLAALPTGRIATTPLRDLIAGFHETTWPERTLWIPATDLSTGVGVVFGRDRTDIDIATAVSASCAIPGYFRPVRIDGRRYVDGAMRSPDNADLLIDEGLDAVIVLSPLTIVPPGGPGRSGPTRRRPAAPVRNVVRGALRAFPRARLDANVATLEEAGIPVLVLQPDRILADRIGLNAMSPSKLRPLVGASIELIMTQLAPGVDPEERAERGDLHHHPVVSLLRRSSTSAAGSVSARPGSGRGRRRG